GGGRADDPGASLPGERRRGPGLEELAARQAQVRDRNRWASLRHSRRRARVAAARPRADAGTSAPWCAAAARVVLDGAADRAPGVRAAAGDGARAATRRPRLAAHDVAGAPRRELAGGDLVIGHLRSARDV